MQLKTVVLVLILLAQAVITRKVLKSGQPAPPRVDPIKMEHLRSTKRMMTFCIT